MHMDSVKIKVRALVPCVLVFIKGFGFSSGLCPGNLCLDWKISKDELTLSCRIDKLSYIVSISDPHGNTQGDCLPLYPSAHCESHFKNATLFMNDKTKIATYVVRGRIDRSINGIWTCSHGRGYQSAQCNVTIIEKAKEKGKNEMVTTNCTYYDRCKDNQDERKITNYGLYVGLTMGFLCFGLVVGLIVGLFCKKKCPKNERTSPRNTPDEENNIGIRECSNYFCHDSMCCFRTRDKEENNSITSMSIANTDLIARAKDKLLKPNTVDAENDIELLELQAN